MPCFDQNATTPLHPAARAAWLEANDTAWANPAAAHRAGARVRALLDRERGRLAGLLGCPDSALVFTSGATEAANAVFSHLAAGTPPGAAVMVAPTEHACVRLSATRWFPGRVETVPVDAAGVADPGRLEERIRAGGVAAVAVMAANNETGVLQPVSDLAACCARHCTPFVCDAAQWFGKRPAAGVRAADYVFGAAHKFGGPKGVGVLRLPGGERDRAFGLILGGGQQGGRRAGTEDYPGVAALVAALEAAEVAAGGDLAGRLRWRDEFEKGLLAAWPGTRIAGLGAERLWNTVMAVMPFGANHRWLTKLDRRGFEVGTGSACTAAQSGTSHVLESLGFSAAEAGRALRFSGGWSTTADEWQALLGAVSEVGAEIVASEPA